MDPKRKRLYLILIAVCLTLTAGLLFWNYTSSPSLVVVPTIHTNVNAPNSAAIADNSNSTLPPTGALPSSFPQPLVFPNSETFDSSVLNSTAFKQLQPYNPIDLSDQLGRDDPFKSY